MWQIDGDRLRRTTVFVEAPGADTALIRDLLDLLDSQAGVGASQGESQSVEPDPDDAPTPAPPSEDDEAHIPPDHEGGIPPGGYDYDTDQPLDDCSDIVGVYVSQMAASPGNVEAILEDFFAYRGGTAYAIEGDVIFQIVEEGGPYTQERG